MADGWDVRARRVVAALSAAWAQTIAHLAPHCRRAVAAARSGWALTIAYFASHWRRAVAVTRRSRPAELRERVSQLVKPPPDADRGEYVALSELLETDERDRQYQ